MCRIQTNDMLAVYMLMVMNVEEEEEKKAAGKSVDACFFDFELVRDNEMDVRDRVIIFLACSSPRMAPGFTRYWSGLLTLVRSLSLKLPNAYRLQQLCSRQIRGQGVAAILYAST